MASEPQEYASQVKVCTCGSSNVQYKYKNNKKLEQPRYQCLDCKLFFTLGYFNRPKPQHYNKKRGIDPEELRELDRQCWKCGGHNAMFKYYNNQKKVGKTQPRFECLSCGENFSMRFDGKTLMPSKRRKTAPLGAEAPALPGPGIVDDPDVRPGAYEDDVENVAQTDYQSSNTEDAVSYASSAPTEQYYDGGQCSYSGEVESDVPMEQYYNGGQCFYNGRMEASVPIMDQVYYNGGRCSYSTGVPMEQYYDGAQCSYTGQLEVAGATTIPNENTVSKSEHYVTANASQELEQVHRQEFYITHNQVYNQPPFQKEQSDVDKFASIHEYNHVSSAEHGVLFSNTDAWVHESNGGQCSDYFEEVVAGSAVIPVEQYYGGQPCYTEAQVEVTATMSPPDMIPYDDATAIFAGELIDPMIDWEHVGQSLNTADQGSALPALVEQSDVGNNTSAYEYDVVGDQFSMTGIVQEAQSDVGQGSYSEEMEAPAIHSVDECGYEVVSADQEVDHVSNTDAVMVEQSDGSQCPFSLFLSRFLPAEISCSE